MARSLFADDITCSRLMLVFVALVLCGSEVHSQVNNPGLQFRLSEAGFDYLGEVVFDRLYDAAQTILIPDMNGTTSMSIGSVDYTLEDMSVTEVVKPSSNVEVSADQITWTLTNASISISGNWTYKFDCWFFTTSDAGTFTVSVNDASISLPVSLGLDSTGHPNISTAGCNCSIPSVSTRLSGRSSWLYGIFIDYIESLLQSQLETKICEVATGIVNGDVNHWLALFPLQQTVATDYLFDYSFLSAPQIQNGFMDTKHKAAFYYKEDKTEAPIQTPPIPTTTSNRMLTLWISDYVPNTIGSVLYRQNILRYTLTKANIEGSVKNYLNTTCPSSTCFGTIFPILSNQYPNAAVEAEMSATEAPTSTISSNVVQVTFNGTISFGVRLTNGSLVNFLTTGVLFKVSSSVYLNGTKVMSKVTKINHAVKNILRSYMGSVSRANISAAINHIGRSFIIPKLNEKGQQVIELPVQEFVKFKDVSLDMQNRCLRFAANVERSP